MYRATEFVSFRRAFHEPVAIDAQNVEPMEAIVDPYQVNSVSEGLSFQVGLWLAEWLEADRASASQSVIVRTDTLPHILIH